MGTPTPPTALDPVTMYDGSAVGVVQLVAQYLLWLETDFTLKPQLATSWRGDRAGRVWSFTLREGVAFSDGTPLTSAAVKASFDRLLDPKSKSSALASFDGILAAGGVDVRGDHTVVFTLQRPFSDFPYLVSAANYNAVILKSDYAGDFSSHPVGTGPFLLKSYDASTGATLVRNPSYWEQGRPYLDGVKVRFFSDTQAEQIALQSGDLDALILTDATAVTAAGDVVLDKAASTIMTAFTMRVDRAPFDKKEVRQAIAYALDRPAIDAGTNNNFGQLGNDHLFAPLFAASPTDLPQRAKDPDKAKALLQAAGVSQLSFTLTFDPMNKNYALVVQDQLGKIGIKVKLKELPSSQFYGGDQSSDTPWLFTDANLVSWAGRPIPSQFIGPMVTSHGVWNGSKYANPAVDTALKAYDAATDAAERKKQAAVIAGALHEDVPVILAVWDGAVRAYNRRTFQGISAHPSSFVDFSAVSRA
ncbi:ABC transporter substrate-binding protein [Streptomyces sp. NPDC093228]|uniref:ABC transporter substrate-binding protein n=1 Tax=Streptomyces sp. NPDC093228 TaxID=3155070 RepID=UPI003417C5EC